MSDKFDTGWVARYKYGELDVAEVQVIKRTPKRVTVRSCEASGYRTNMEPQEVFESERLAIESVIPRIEYFIGNTKEELQTATETLVKARERISELKS